MHAFCRLGAAGLAVSLLAPPAMAVNEVLAAPKQTTSVAAFPDAPGAAPTAHAEPPKRADSSEELLQKSPYPATTEVRGTRDVPMANPYVEELRIVHSETVSPDSPYAEAMHPDHHRETTDLPPSPTSTALKDPYGAPGTAASVGAPGTSDTKQGIPADLKNPYAASEARAVTLPPARPSSELILELPAAFQGVILVDGLAAPFLGRAAFPLPPGHHTVSVFPKEGHPYQLPLFVRPNRTERLPIP